MVLETISLASFYPLLEILSTSVENTKESELRNFFINILKYFNVEESNLFVAITLIAASLFILKILILLFCNWHISNFTFALRFYLTKILYKTYLRKKYQSLIKYNSADIIKNIDFEIHQFASGISAFMTCLTEGIIFFGIITFLFFFNIKITLTILLFCLLIFLILQFSYNKFLISWGNAAQKHNKQRVQNFLETFNAIKEIKIFGKEDLFYDLMTGFNKKFFDANRNQRFLTNVPKAVLELSLIIIISIYLINLYSQNYSFNDYFAEIGIYLIAAYRVFPSINRIIVSLQGVKFVSTFMENITEQILSEKNNENINIKDFDIWNELKFKKSVELVDCSFNFDSGKNIINKLSLKFELGKMYGIKGTSGSGKTTVLNLLSGLLSPQSGKIYLDKKEVSNETYNKFSQVSYVPQNVFLFDTTIAKNIHLDMKDDSENNSEKILSLLKELGLDKKINSLKNGLNTRVGERGVNLSGGQIQRIGLARALYHQPKLLILDESTNAIEKDLELKVLDYLSTLKKDKIIVLVAHRESAFKNCDQIYKLT